MFKEFFEKGYGWARFYDDGNCTLEVWGMNGKIVWTGRYAAELQAALFGR